MTVFTMRYCKRLESILLCLAVLVCAALPARAADITANSAQLIAGDDKYAVRFLQGELGKLALVDSSEQLRVGHKALSRDGMISSGGGVDRRGLSTKAGLRTIPVVGSISALRKCWYARFAWPLTCNAGARNLISSVTGVVRATIESSMH